MAGIDRFFLVAFAVVCLILIFGILLLKNPWFVRKILGGLYDILQSDTRPGKKRQKHRR